MFGLPILVFLLGGNAFGIRRKQGRTYLSAFEATQPYGRLIKPPELARVIAFYLSDDESGMMTGALVDFDQQVLGAADTAPRPSRALAV